VLVLSSANLSALKLLPWRAGHYDGLPSASLLRATYLSLLCGDLPQVGLQVAYVVGERDHADLTISAISLTCSVLAITFRLLRSCLAHFSGEAIAADLHNRNLSLVSIDGTTRTDTAVSRSSSSRETPTSISSSISSNHRVTPQRADSAQHLIDASDRSRDRHERREHREQRADSKRDVTSEAACRYEAPLAAPAAPPPPTTNAPPLVAPAQRACELGVCDDVDPKA
jgi:hypothetical protein